MDMAQRSIVVAVFEDRSHADQALAELRQNGFADDQIGVVMRRTGEATETTRTSGETYTEEGGVAGALAGAGLGALAGLGVLAGVVPVIGPAIAGGTLGIVLSNAALGAGVAGLTGALIGWGFPEEEARYYHGELEAGRTIVTVRADDRTDQAWTILQGHGAHDMKSRTAVARS
jgi:hypothetical protein